MAMPGSGTSCTVTPLSWRTSGASLSERVMTWTSTPAAASMWACIWTARGMPPGTFGG